MNALIIGCGTLGRRVSRRLRAEGVAVSATTRSADRARGLAAEGITPIVCDILQPESLAQLGAADVVFHAVANDRSTAIPPRQLHLDGLAHVLDRLAGRVGRFVLAGSTGVYGQTDGSWVDETSPTEPLSDAGRIGLDAERLLRSALPDAVVLRFAGLYGPERFPRRQALERGEPVAGDPDHVLNLIHLDDASRFAVAALLAPQSGPLYVVGDGHPVRRRDFYGEMAALLRLPAPVFAAMEATETRIGRDVSHKRVQSDRIVRELGLACLYPDYRAGLRAALA